MKSFKQCVNESSFKKPVELRDFVGFDFLKRVADIIERHGYDAQINDHSNFDLDIEHDGGEMTFSINTREDTAFKGRILFVIFSLSEGCYARMGVPDYEHWSNPDDSPLENAKGLHVDYPFIATKKSTPS